MLKREGAMINIKNITKVLLLAMFISVCFFDANAQSISTPSQGTGKGNSANVSEIDRSKTSGEAPFTIDRRLPVVSIDAVSAISSNITQDSSFCGEGTGVFGELVKTGQTIFYRLRDLIYVVAGFGIIAVAVGGFFGNMNWKWLSAIVLALIVIASAGELIVLLTGCEQYGTTLITNTLKSPTKKVDVQGK